MGWRNRSSLLVLAILALLVGACTSGAEEPRKRAHATSEHEEDQHAGDQGHGVEDAHGVGVVPLVSLGSPLFRHDADPDKLPGVNLQPLVRAEHEGVVVALATLGSPLFRDPNDIETIPPVRLAPLATRGGGAPAPSNVPGTSSAVAPPPANRNAGPPPLSPPVSGPVSGPGRSGAAAQPSPSPVVPDVAVISGRLESTDDRVLSVRNERGVTRVAVPPSARLEVDGRGALDDLRPGTFVGAVARPGEAARLVRVYVRGPGMPEAGLVPMAGPDQGSLTTYGTVLAVYPRLLSVDTGGQVSQVPLQAGVSIVKPVAADLLDVPAGAYLVAVGRRRADGAIAATSVRLTVGP